MLEKIDTEELTFCEDLYNPVALTECLFSNVDNLAAFEEDTFSHIRLGQLPLLSYEYMLDYNQQLTQKQNFKLREGAGNIWCLGGRKFGKTLFVEIIDTLLSMVLIDAEHCGFSSFDALHIRGVIEKILVAVESHPFFKIFNPHVSRNPNYRIHLQNSGYVLDTVNMNIASKRPGAGFFQKHFHRLVIEEKSFETEEIYTKRRESVTELGCVLRCAGMTNFTKHSPTGREYYDLTKKPWVLNLPQYINPTWDKEEKERAIKEYGGENSTGFRVFVEGVVVEEGLSVFDMQRVRNNYLEVQIKHIEITKENFPFFENLLIVERPSNSDMMFLAADIGETAPSELIIIAKINDKYRYLYNITLYNLSDKEQEKIFSYLIERCNMNLIGLDTSEGTGRAVFRSLEEKYTREHLCWVAFTEKVVVDFERDENNNVLFKDGQPLYKEEFVTDWSVKRLRDLLYDEKMVLPLDYKFDVQLNSVQALISGVRTIYECLSEEDHLFAAFRVFAIMEWQYEFKNTRPVIKKRFFKGII